MQFFNLFVHIQIQHIFVNRFVKVLGTHNSLNKCFHLVSFECMYSTGSLQAIDGIMGMSHDFQIAKNNRLQSRLLGGILTLKIGPIYSRG